MKSARPRTSSSRRVALALGLVSVVSSAACASLPKAPAYPRKDDAFSAPEAVVRGGIPGDKPVPFALQPGDLIDVDIASDPPRTITELGIDATGRVHMPLIGDVEVGGRGLTEAEGRIQAALRRFDRFAEVSVRLRDGKGQRVTVLGAVATQGVIQLTPGSRVADIIALAGGPLTGTSDSAGPTVLADLGGAVVTRNGTPLPISVSKALEGDPLHNVYMRPGDSVYVPPELGNSISVLGQVGSPRMVSFRKGLRLSQLLALAGGVTTGADKGDIRVIRGTLERPRVYRASLADFVDGEAHDVLMRPGDIVFVTDHPIEDLGEVVGVISPILSLGLTTAVLVPTVINASKK